MRPDVIREKLGVTSESRIGTINAVFRSKPRISPELVGNYEGITLEIISGLGGQTPPD
jgi:hypothetical protein